MFRNIKKKPGYKVFLTILAWGQLKYLFLLVPLLGLVLTTYGLCSAFPRSGAVVVAVAIYVFYMNHGVSAEIQEAKAYLESTSHMTNYNSSKRVFGRGAKPENAEKIEELIKTHLKTRAAHAKFLSPLKEASMTLTTAEATAGIVGTIVWGFGDIPGKYICEYMGYCVVAC